ncbi:MAG: VOC family protein [Sphingomonas sp.]
MAAAYIEHVNVTVRDPARSAALMNALFGWHERWRGAARDGGFTIHVGSDSAYLALYTGPDGADADALFEKGVPLNHIGIEVDDLDAVEARVIEAGLLPFAHGDYEPGRRFYFFDENGIEFEIVSYAQP